MLSLVVLLYLVNSSIGASINITSTELPLTTSKPVETTLNQNEATKVFEPLSREFSRLHDKLDRKLLITFLLNELTQIDNFNSSTHLPIMDEKTIEVHNSTLINAKARFMVESEGNLTSTETTSSPNTTELVAPTSIIASTTVQIQNTSVQINSMEAPNTAMSQTTEAPNLTIQLNSTLDLSTIKEELTEASNSTETIIEIPSNSTTTQSIGNTENTLNQVDTTETTTTTTIVTQSLSTLTTLAPQTTTTNKTTPYSFYFYACKYNSTTNQIYHCEDSKSFLKNMTDKIKNISTSITNKKFKLCDLFVDKIICEEASLVGLENGLMITTNNPTVENYTLSDIVYTKHNDNLFKMDLHTVLTNAYLNHVNFIPLQPWNDILKFLDDNDLYDDDDIDDLFGMNFDSNDTDDEDD